jgi:hypothetical protein
MLSTVARNQALRRPSIFIARFGCELASILAILVILAIVGLHLDAWTEGARGDDAFMHLSRAQYVLDSFPHLSWYHQWFAGYPPFEFYDVGYYIVLTASHLVSGISLETLLTASGFVGMAASGVAIYVLGRVLGLPRLLCLGFAFLFLANPDIWNWLLIGGGYKRLFALPFNLLSIALVYLHATQIDRGAETRPAYLATVIVLALSAGQDPLLWQFTFVMVLLLYLLAIRTWQRKVSTVLRVFVPVGALTAWLYFPLLASYFQFTSAVEGAPMHDTAPVNWEWLFTLPVEGSFRVTFGPAITFLFIFCVGIFLGTFGALLRERQKLRPELALMLIQGLFAGYFFAFSYFRLPSSLYSMAAYSHVLHLGLSLLILSMVTIAAARRVGAFDLLTPKLGTGILVAFVAFSLASGYLYLPYIRGFNAYANPLEPGTVDYAVKPVLDVAIEHSRPGQRLGAFERCNTRGANYVYPEQEIVGGRATNPLPQRYYLEWAHATLIYHDDQEMVPKIYFDDRPKVVRSFVGGQDNYYPNLFWLDWYASSGPILNAPFQPVQQTAAGYGERAQLFRQYPVDTEFGTAFFFEDPSSTTSVIAPSGRTIALPFLKGGAPPFYVDFLDLLSSMNLNSQRIVPVKLDEAEGLERFDTALVPYTEYRRNQEVLDAFVDSGGTLAVMGVAEDQANDTIVGINDLGVFFHARAALIDPLPGGEVLAFSLEGPIASRNRSGLGTLVLAGVSPQALVDSSSSLAAILLAELLGLERTVQEPDILGSSVTWATAGTEASVVQPGPEETGGTAAADDLDGLPYLQFISDPSLSHNQINWGFPLGGFLPSDESGLVTFSLWHDGKPLSIIDLVLASSETDSILYYSLPVDNDVWNGWRDFAIPLSYFRDKGAWEPGQTFDSVLLVFDQSPPYTDDSLQPRTFAVRNLKLLMFPRAHCEELQGKWLRPDQFSLDLQGHQRVLWKESYLSRWVVTTEKGEKVDHYFAGPGMIYLEAPEGAKTLIFEMPYSRWFFFGLFFIPVGAIGIVYGLLDNENRLLKLLGRAAVAFDKRIRRS